MNRCHLFGWPGCAVRDHIKSASGLGVPLIGIGLYYSHGYFKQHLDHDGYQREEYIETKFRTCRSKRRVVPMVNRSQSASILAMGACSRACN